LKTFKTHTQKIDIICFCLFIFTTTVGHIVFDGGFGVQICSWKTPIPTEHRRKN